MYTQMGVLTRGTVIEVNVSELGMVTTGGKVVWGKFAQVSYIFRGLGRSLTNGTIDHQRSKPRWLFERVRDVNRSARALLTPRRVLLV